MALQNVALPEIFTAGKLHTTMVGSNGSWSPLVFVLASGLIKYETRMVSQAQVTGFVAALTLR